LRDVSVRALDLTLLQAGAGIKGEFENRLKNLIEEVKSSAVPIILFIDEAHTMIGAGGAAGQSDAANILKPALARGELRTVAATTWSEYKRYFERDAALARRFQVVKVEEPTEAQCLVMMRGVSAALEKHHGVRILGEAAEAAVRLSHRYLSGRQLPDKAVSVLDTACARISLSQNSLPAPLEDAERQLDDLASQERSLQRESAAGADHAELLAAVSRSKAELQSSLTALRTLFVEVRRRVGKIRELRAQLENGAASTQAAAKLRTDLVRLNAELDRLQGDQPLLHVCVDSQLVSEIISQWTGIPVGNMLKDQLRAVLDLEGELAQRVIGQPEALQAIARRIRTSRARLEDPNKPVGAFLLVGPSGVGKTETALALADLLYGGERNLFSLSMSEFQEAHTVSVLKGAPPGYVGFDEGGILTEAVRRRPYSVVLLDEVEKAHPDVLELFIQVLDKGVMEDGKGREIDFRNTVVLLTSNASVEAVRTLFKPAFLNLLVTVPYAPVRDEALRKIVILKLRKIRERLQANHHIQFDWDDALVEHVALRSMEVEGGARNVDHILTNSMLPEISRQILERMADGGKVTGIRAGLNAEGGFAFA
jgi:type VI secretion system protein VasG